MKMTLKRSVGGFSALSLAFLVACGGNEENNNTTNVADPEDTNDNAAEETNNNAAGNEDNTEAEAEELLEDSTLVLAMGTDMVSWDIHDHGNTSTEAVHVNVFDYLFKRDSETMEVEPHLVADYENIEDDVWEFTLHDDIYFHNGDQMTAEDVKFTFDRVIEDDTLSEHSRFVQLGEIEVVDDLTVRMNTDGPQPSLLNRLAGTGASILPKEYIEENGMDHFLSEPIGSGPYEFDEWARDDRVVLTKFDDYFLGDDFTEWEEVVFRAIPETSTRVGELLTGNAHVVTDIPPNEWSRIDDNDGTRHINADSNREMLIITRQTEGVATSDPRVVEAIDLAIDNEAITEQVMQGSGTPTRTRVTPGNVGANEDLYDTFVYDQDRARELLAEAGYEDGLEITMQSPQGRYLMDSDIAEVIVGMLSEVGITVDLQFLEWSQFIEHYQNNTNEELMLLGLASSLFDAAQNLDHYTTTSPLNEGRMDYSNEEVDELFEAALVNMDPDEREQQYQRIQEILAEERPHIYLHSINMNYGVSDLVDYEPRQDELYYANEITRR
ncbi:peptide ABC transporter substrate-binding protein [Salipaludibacillus keqinensis]|uniref:Peptide ABC transporter substrate-binding protein n=1 Tax=Salipaludibacillus keqinensis TaxID=2045207 RepID=A0A323TFM6_9BACI|nr:ABC transporter substrate-binding protein [Salipaludibacillus keqinensis]PYZ92734.1 peptide ABC transporter substrate-binding protein [Salipaludibacillus keqinensis]